MAVWDLLIGEFGNGGDITLLGNDIAVTGSIETAIYCAMFGGNVESDTVVPRPFPDQDFSWWGNALFLSQLPDCQFNSLTERTLNNTALISAGRVTIENAIKKDLQFLGSGLTVNVSIISTDRINVSVGIVLPSDSVGVATFSLVRGTSDGDFNFEDFNFNDFT